MQRLRHATVLARFVLAWFALTMTAAIASPWVHAAAAGQVCSATAGLESAPGGPTHHSGHGLDCPLCVGAAPPFTWRAPVAAEQPSGTRIAWLPTQRVAVKVGAPLPARGPPKQVFQM